MNQGDAAASSGVPTGESGVVAAASGGRLGAIFKAYDVRGVVPAELDPDRARAIGFGFAKLCLGVKAGGGTERGGSGGDRAPAVAEAGDRTRIVVARDMRPSGTELAGAFMAGAQAAGVSVVDAGLASTDMLYFSAGRLDCPGAMFTASHNPAQYNGIKLCYEGARPVGQETGLAEVKQLAEKALETGEHLGPPADGTRRAQADLLGEFAEHVLSFVDVNRLAELTVAADAANGMGGLVVPEVFARLPFRLFLLYPELDGTFPNHPADPIQEENLADLKKMILSQGADVGLAFDGDADRVFLVDENARPVSGSTTTALVAASMLEKNPGATILYNIICSKAVRETIAELGGIGVRTRVGHSFIKKVMEETGAVFGGEHSGHYYFRDNYRADSGLIAAMVVLELMSRTGRRLSELVAPYDRYTTSGEINLHVEDPARCAAEVASLVEGRGVDCDRTDGLTVDFGDWWFNLRPSNTEPLLRLNVEIGKGGDVQAKVEEVRGMIEAGSGNGGPEMRLE